MQQLACSSLITLQIFVLIFFKENLPKNLSPCLPAWKLGSHRAIIWVSKENFWQVASTVKDQNSCEQSPSSSSKKRLREILKLDAKQGCKNNKRERGDPSILFVQRHSWRYFWNLIFYTSLKKNLKYQILDQNSTSKYKTKYFFMVIIIFQNDNFQVELRENLKVLTRKNEARKWRKFKYY